MFILSRSTRSLEALASEGSSSYLFHRLRVSLQVLLLKVPLGADCSGVSYRSASFTLELVIFAVSRISITNQMYGYLPYVQQKR